MVDLFMMVLDMIKLFNNYNNQKIKMNTRNHLGSSLVQVVGWFLSLSIDTTIKEHPNQFRSQLMRRTADLTIPKRKKQIPYGITYAFSISVVSAIQYLLGLS